MNYAALLKSYARQTEADNELDVATAEQLFGALLDGGVPEMEMGAILMALRLKGETDNEFQGFYDALEARQYLLPWPSSGIRPVVIPSYYGTRSHMNLTPLLALLLVRFGVPVLIHGTLEGSGRVKSAYVLRELGIMPCASLTHAHSALMTEGIAFVPTAVIAPGLANLLALRNRLGVRNSAHTLVKLLSPFKSEALRLIPLATTDQLERMRIRVEELGIRALILTGTEGEPFANINRRPELWYCEHGQHRLLFEAEVGTTQSSASLPLPCDATGTAAWIREALAGKHTIPLPIINQLACCLFGAGYTSDMNQAKAIVAMEVGGLVTL